MKDYENEDMMRNGVDEQNGAVSEENEQTVGEAAEEIVEEALREEAGSVTDAADDTVPAGRQAENETQIPERPAAAESPVTRPAPWPQNAQPVPGNGTNGWSVPERPVQPSVYQNTQNGAYSPYGHPYEANSGRPAPRPQPAQTWTPYPGGVYGQSSGQTPSGMNGTSYGARSAYQGQTYNAYAAPSSAPVRADSRNGGEIAYAPAKKKEKKTVGLRAVACICAACVLLSGAFGFGGTLLANRLNGNSSDSAVTETQRPAASSQASSGESVVIYKSVDDVATSTAATAGGDLTYAQVAALVKDSVVEINTEYTTRNSWFQYTTGGAGSGVIISQDGYIITNAHVILDENMQNVADTVTVRLTNGEEYKAEVERYDADEDIAIIKIDASGLTPARVGDSDKLVVGEELVIVGNPLGELGGSVSNGIVSATEREIQVGGVTMHLIQTNAAVNPGNSGGGMFNMKGQLVGIVNAKSSGSGIEGLGFAIPINQALTVTEQLLTYGYVRGRPMIGVSFEDVSGSNYFFYYSVKAGVYVRSLTKGMNDDVLKEGDRIIAVNGEEISSSDDIKAIVYASAIGDKLTFQLYRDNKLLEVEVTCYERTPENVGSSISFGTEEVPGSLDDFFGGR